MKSKLISLVPVCILLSIISVGCKNSADSDIGGVASLQNSKTSSVTSNGSSDFNLEVESQKNDTSTDTVSTTSSKGDSSIVSSGDSSTTIQIDGKTYQSTFYDDFDGEKLDKNKWRLCPEYNRQDVGGRWDDDMVWLDGNGNLIIGADIKDGVPVTGAVRTLGKFQQARGFFEIRCKLQEAPGFWGAFWLLSSNMSYSDGDGAKNGAEIDIFESFDAKSGGINHAVHWDGYGSNHQQVAKSVYNKDLYDGQYHTFSLLWTENEYVFYIDGKESYRLDSSVYNFPGSCEKKCYLKVTAEFGSWAGNYNKNSLPDCLTVDYVRVYEEVNS